MAKRSLKTDDETAPPPAHNAIDDEALPGETMEDYMTRMDEQDSEWRGKHGAQGAAKHDANEHRAPAAKLEEDEAWDPHMGLL